VAVDGGFGVATGAEGRRKPTATVDWGNGCT
jgi:hypothetical protein